MAVLFLFAASLCAETDSPAPNERDAESILVLLSGEIIQGQVSRLDDKFVVGLPTGRIFVPQNSVEIVCKDLREAYNFRRGRMGQGQVQDHAELAQWCQRHGLDSEAEAELQIAKRLNPNHPVVGLVERRLLAARLPHREASKSQPAEEGTTQPTAQQLEEFAAGLPSGTVEAFTRVVQPLLVNRCATSGCHTDRSENEFRLDRPRPGVPLGRTSTNRNLHATLKLVDATAPDECELLRPKKCPHRLQTESPFSLAKSSQYRFLVAWVTLLTRQSAGRSERPAVAKASPPETIRSGPPEPSPEASPPATLAEIAQSAFDAAGADEAPEANFGITPPGRQSPPVDPFDPDIFNRRYGTSPPPKPVNDVEKKVPVPSPFFSG